MYLIKQRIREYLFVNFALYKYLLIIIITFIFTHALTVARILCIMAYSYRCCPRMYLFSALGDSYSSALQVKQERMLVSQLSKDSDTRAVQYEKRVET